RTLRVRIETGAIRIALVEQKVRRVLARAMHHVRERRRLRCLHVLDHDATRTFELGFLAGLDLQLGDDGEHADWPRRVTACREHCNAEAVGRATRRSRRAGAARAPATFVAPADRLRASAPRRRAPRAQAASDFSSLNDLIFRMSVLRPMPKRRAARLWFQLQRVSTVAM